MNFELKPYSQVGILQFDMSEGAVLNLLGVPSLMNKNRRGETDFKYDDFFIRFSSSLGRLVEVGFLPSSELIFDNLSVFKEAGLVEKLISLDEDVYEYFGFLVFFGIGLTLTGFHDDDPSQKAATCFSRGRWDHLKPDMKRFNFYQ